MRGLVEGLDADGGKNEVCNAHFLLYQTGWIECTVVVVVIVVGTGHATSLKLFVERLMVSAHSSHSALTHCRLKHGVLRGLVRVQNTLATADLDFDVQLEVDGGRGRGRRELMLLGLVAAGQRFNGRGSGVGATGFVACFFDYGLALHERVAGRLGEVVAGETEKEK